MIRTLALAGGMAGALALSQFPEFSQQYLQRLSGALDELRPLVLSLDGVARVSGLDRAEALDRIGGNPVADEMRGRLSAAALRYDRLAADAETLRPAGPVERLALPWRFRDTDILRATLADFRPALPLTPAGLICAGIGFAGGWLAVALPLGALRRILFGRRAA
ncbi:MAG: DUF2937 family protein [Tranquillimonas sp.]|jgi:hypothetical protein